MKWSEISEPVEGFKSSYDYVVAQTPLGTMRIEWKSWEEVPSYVIELDKFNVWIEPEYTLEEAKNTAEEYLKNKLEELTEYLNGN